MSLKSSQAQAILTNNIRQSPPADHLYSSFLHDRQTQEAQEAPPGCRTIDELEMVSLRTSHWRLDLDSTAVLFLGGLEQKQQMSRMSAGFSRHMLLLFETLVVQPTVERLDPANTDEILELS